MGGREEGFMKREIIQNKAAKLHRKIGGNQGKAHWVCERKGVRNIVEKRARPGGVAISDRS
jgi:hypothetical protein